MNGTAPSPSHRRVFPATASSVSAARAFVMSALGAEPVSADGVAALRLVVSELVSNAVQHGTDDGVEVSIDVSDGEWLQVRVAGRGDPRFPITDVALWTIASSDGVSGRGLGIVRSLAHDVRAEVVDGVVSVHCRVRR